jgi:predicted PurR-regulated permease PerM
VTEHLSSAERWRRTAIKAWASIGVLLLLGAAGWLLTMMSPALVPFGIGLIVVLLLRRPVDWLSERTNRTAAVALCYLVAIVVVGVALTFIVPPVAAQISAFMQALPGYVRQAYALWDAWVVHPRQGSGIPSWLQTAVLGLKDQVVAGVGTWSSAIASTAIATGGSIATGVVSFVLALIIGFFTLVDLPRLTAEIYALAGPSWREEIEHASATLARVLGGWLKGTLIQSSVVAVLISVGLAIVGVPYALALGVIGGIFNIVPYVGPSITAVLAAAAGLFVSPWAALWAVVVVVIVQQFDSLFMAPRVMSEQVDLHPLLVIFALLVGAALFGTWGMVLSVPAAAIIKAMFVFWYEKRTARQITSDDGVLFPTAKDEPAHEASEG